MAHGGKDVVSSECTVCQEIFRDPVFITCGHTFCRDCLSDWHRQKPGKTLICPICRQVHNLGRGGVPGLPKNYALIGLLDKKRGSEKIPCLVCEVIPPRDAVNSCIQCKLSYCSDCLDQLHPHHGALGLHQLVKARLIINPPFEPLCEDHREPLKMFCTDCKVQICLVCDRVGTHRYHKVAGLKTASEQLRKELQKESSFFQSEIATCMKNIDHLKSSLQSRQNKVAKFQSSVTSSYDAVAQIIVDKKNSILSQSAKIVKDQETDVNSRISEIKDKMEEAKECLRPLSEVLTEKEHTTFLKAVPALPRRYPDRPTFLQGLVTAVKDSVQLPRDNLGDIIKTGSYVITIAESEYSYRESNMTIQVKDGQLKKSNCGIQ